MAGKLTTFSIFNEYSSTVKILKLAITADSVDFTVDPNVLTGCSGKTLESIVVVNGTTGLLAASVITATDSITAVNLVSSTGLAIGTNSTTHYIEPDIVKPIILGTLTIAITGNTVASATCTVYIVVRSK